MYQNIKEDFYNYAQEWRDTLAQYIPSHRENDLVFTVINAVAVTTFNGTQEYKERPYWLLEHNGTLVDAEIRMYFDTEADLYIWGCNFLANRIRKILSIHGPKE